MSSTLYPWWAFQPGSAGVVATGRRRGVTRTNNRQFVDDAGPFRPNGATLFWAMQGWRTERERFKQNARFIKATQDADHARLLSTVGWLGRGIDPADKDHEQTLADVTDWLWDELGMRTLLSVIGSEKILEPNGQERQIDVMMAANKAADVIAARPEKFLAVEAANESYQNLPDEAKVIAITKLLRQRTPNLVGASDPAPIPGGLDRAIQMGIAAGATVFFYHSDRGTGTGGAWRMVRQAWDCKEFPLAVHSNEPPGLRSSVSELTDPLMLAALRGLSTICGGGAWLLHCGSMVTGLADPSKNRPPNVWEIPGVEAAMAAVRNVDRLLPEGCENWRKANTGWAPPLPVAPFQPDAYWPDSDRGVNKAYAAIDGDRFVQMPIGITGRVAMTATRQCRAEAVNLLTGEVIDRRGFSPGQTWILGDNPPALLLRNA